MAIADVLSTGEYLATLNDCMLADRVYDNNDVQNYIVDSLELLDGAERCRVRFTHIELPDAACVGPSGSVLVWCVHTCCLERPHWSIEPYVAVSKENAAVFQKWAYLPEEETKDAD